MATSCDGLQSRTAIPVEGAFWPTPAAPSRDIRWSDFAQEALEPPVLPPASGPAPVSARIASGQAVAPAAATARRMPRVSGGARLLLPAILALQAAFSLRLVWSNAAYQDEALYLWAGRLEISHWTNGAWTPPFATYFSGSPTIYPPIAAIANEIGGLAAARILSLIFMLGATVLLYATTARLLGSGSAVAAATFFATFGLGVELGAVATYDAMAVFLTALGAYLAVRAGQAMHGEPLLMLAGCVLALATATEYTAALWDPIVICLAVLTGPRNPRLRYALRAARLTCYTTVPVIVALLAGGASYLRGIAFTTVHRQIVTGTPPLRVLDIAWGWLALPLLLGFLGTVLIWYNSRHILVGPLVLMAAAVLAPIAQADIHDITSLHKHVVLGAWFLCIVAGHAASKIAFLDGRLSQGAVISVVLIAVFAGTGYSQASALYRSWPSVAAAMPPLARAMAADGCPCLISQVSDARYYLPAADLTGPIVGPYTFTYQDAATPVALSGQAAMAAAIRNGYFGAVEIDGLRTPGMYALLLESLRRSRQYKLTYEQYWPGQPREPTQVWQRTEIAGP